MTSPKPSHSPADATLVARLLADGGLTVLLPLHNLAQSAYQNLSRLHTYLSSLNIPFSLVPIDDGSTDDTAVALHRFAETHLSCSPVLLPENRGKGAAILAGLPKVETPWVLLLDGDLDLDPTRLPDFAAVALTQGADLVVGSKRHPHSDVHYPLRRRAASAIYHSFTQLFLRLPLTDTQCGMKLIRTQALQYAAPRMLVKAFAFDLELLAIARQGGYILAEAPVRIADFGRKWGCLTPSMLWHTLRDTLAILYRARLLHYYAALTPLPPPPPAASGPKFSLIVACPGDSLVLRRLIAALRDQTYRNFEVLFLPDHLLVRPRTNYPFRIVATGSVRPAKKRNLGAALATGDILAFIDDDAYPRPDWLEVAAARFASESHIHALGGPGLTPPEDPPLAQLSGIVFASPLVSGNFRYRYFVQGPLRRIEDFPSCNLFVRTAAFQAIGGFREDFWPGEDTLLCADLQRRDYALWYEPRLVVWHHRRPLLGPHLRQVGRYALHRGYFARRIGLNSRRLSYLLPSLFLLGLLFGPVAAAFLPLLWLPYLATVGLYLLITLADALLEAPALPWVSRLWGALMLTHLVYGARFLQGLFATRMPCQVRPFDHR